MASAGGTLGVALGVALTACGPTVGTPSAEDDDASVATSSVGSSAGSSVTGLGDETGFDPGSTSIDDHDPCGDSCCGFYGGCGGWDVGPSVECDVLGQDCPDGQKCSPWDNTGGGEWNATKCVPLSPDPGQAGEPCMVEGSKTSGIDDCDAGLACFGVDASTNEGRCVELCDAHCSDEGTACTNLVTNFIGTCLAPCDPLEPACEEHEGCYPSVHGEFACAPDGSGEAGQQGDPCAWVTDCAPGLTCVDPDALAECEVGVSGGCCTSLCDLSEDGSCGEDLPDLLCASPWDDADVGACRLP